MADLRISDLVTASQLKDDDYYEIAQSESGTRVSYKTTLLAIAVQIATMVDFTSDLNTTSKKITGAINELKQLISLIPQFSIEVVEELPTEDISDTTIYLVPAEDPEVGNYYEEYIHVNNTWELVGTTAVDLSAYYTKLEVDGLLADKLEADDFEANQTASANPITLETKQAGLAKSCIVSFGPIQDLHGYDHPWAGGAGKNKLPFDIAEIISNNQGGTWSGNIYTYRGITFTPDSEGRWKATGTATEASFIRVGKFKPSSDSYLINGVSGGSGTTYRIRYRVGDGSSQNMYEGDSNLITVDGDTEILFDLYVSANYTADITFEPMLRLATETDATFAPYSNICPISGRTEASVSRTGKNLFNPINYISYLQADGTYRGNVSAVASIRNTVPSSLIGKRVTFSAYIDNTKEASQPTNVRVFGNFGGVRYDGNGITIGEKGTSKLTVTIVSENDWFGITYGSGGGRYVTFYNMQLEEGNDVTSYSPYTAETKTHQYGQTVYGGVDDFVDGGATSEYGFIEYDGTEDWILQVYSGINTFRLARPSDSMQGIDLISNVYATATAQTVQDGAIYFGASNLVIADSSKADLNDFKSSLATNHLQICYKLATPTTIQLSPEAVKLLKGLNVISTDGDKVQVEFSDIPVGDYSALLDYVKSLEARIQNLES